MHHTALSNGRQKIYEWGYNDAIQDAIRLVREALGDRIVNNAWIPGSPFEAVLVEALAERRFP